MIKKCQPAKSSYHRHEFNICTEPTTFDPLFMENIHDVADTIAEIMIVCGIHRCKAKASKSVVIKAFHFYDIKRHRFDAVETKGICRNELLCEFQCKCMMTHIEALVSYGILKRAIKAFYYGTPDYSIRSPITEAVILKEHEFTWQHAATRTIQLFEPYEHIFYQAHHNYANQIMQIYKELYERLRSRADPVVIEDYNPRGCVQKVVIGTKSPPKLDSEKSKCVEKCKKIEDMKTYIKNLPHKEFPPLTHLSLTNFGAIPFGSKETLKPSLVNNNQVKKKQTPKNIDLNLPRCYQCNCPQLICDCNIERDTGILAIDCSQGPYECRWLRINNNNKADLCIEKRELHQCPVDCPTSESSSESDEHQFCECSVEDEFDESSTATSVEVVKFEQTDNGESLEGIMPKNLSSAMTDTCDIRKLSKLPTMEVSITAQGSI